MAGKTAKSSVGSQQSSQVDSVEAEHFKDSSVHSQARKWKFLDLLARMCLSVGDSEAPRVDIFSESVRMDL
jgi:hypothetical protein